MKYDRIREIENYIREKRSVSLNELLDRFDVSIQTLRRDLKELYAKNVIDKVYGGVIYKDNQVIDVGVRETDNLDKKKIVGQLASSLVEDNDVIFVDSGTTACQIIPFIKDKNVTVVSHSLLVLRELENRNDIKLIALGGQYRREVKSFMFDTNEVCYNFSKVFISTVGLTIQKGLTNNDYIEGEVKKKMISNSRENYIVLDDSKFDKDAFITFNNLEKITGVITNSKPNKKYLDYFKKKGIKCFYK